MKKYSRLPYAEQIKWRIRALWGIVAAMLVYMVVVAELGGGDSRIMTDFANFTSDILLFGGLVFLFWRIAHNKKLLRDGQLRKEQFCAEQDERNRYLHEKSGGIVMDILLVCLLFLTMTAALFNMAAFYMAVAVLVLAVLLKAAAYWVYSRR